MIGERIVFQQTRLEQLNMSEKEARKGDLKGKERTEEKRKNQKGRNRGKKLIGDTLLKM